MNIGLDISSLCTQFETGIACYSRNLVEHLLSLSTGDTYSLFQQYSKYKKFRGKRHFEHTRLYQGRFFPFKKKVDLIHGLDMKVPYWKNHIRIATIHDLFILKDHPEMYCSVRFREKKRSQMEKLLKHVNALVTVSHTSKNELLEMYDFDESKVHVTHLGVSKKFQHIPYEETQQILKKYNLPKSYLLYIGGVSKRKNTKRIIQGYLASRASKDLPLVMVGEYSYGIEDILKEYGKDKYKNQIIFLGYADDSELPALYSQASAFIFATMYEGFGLPILEAMACSTPVVAGEIGAAAEVSQGKATIVDPFSIDSIANGIEISLQKSTAQIEEARNIALSYTWEKCAQNTHAVYKKMLY